MSARKYPVPAEFRGAAGRETAFASTLQLFASGGDPALATWATGVLASIAPPEVPGVGAAAYGLLDPEFEDEVVVALFREDGSGLARWAGSEWTEVPDERDPVGLAYAELEGEVLRDVAAGLAAGAYGVMLRATTPRGWMPKAALAAAAEAESRVFALVDDLDTSAVLELIQVSPGPKVERRSGGAWVEDPEMLARLKSIDPPKVVAVAPEHIESVVAQVDDHDAANPPKDEGVAAAAAAMVAGANPPAHSRMDEDLKDYWTHGKGAVKIRWGTAGDFNRCTRAMAKYMGPGQVKGACANLHKIATGTWPGKGRKHGRTAAAITEEGTMFTESSPFDGPEVHLPLTAAGVLRPPRSWFEDPGLTGPTPLTVTADGQVYGHIAAWGVRHIGLPGNIQPPRSRSKYAFFRTGELTTDDGGNVSVGQLTLAGGHAPLSADAGATIRHYDDTASAVADLAAGEDSYGIWVNGSLRPGTTDEQVRVLRASAPSGDWRPINGDLELVAICQVNVPGFPVARARVASGATMALVAAGAYDMAARRYAGALGIEDRVARLEAATKNQLRQRVARPS